ncbi:hypothetical protein ONZ45_g4173 [Pleurotus djamor]|nr:hypothetical protein ONZ45_g4173 [Pleurotus djamor]
MAGNYVFSLQPTFTQGLIFGQLSILVLLILILKYLFLDSSQYPFESSTYHPRVDGNNISLRNRSTASHAKEEDVAPGGTTESSEWLNMLLQQIVDVYRGKLRDDLPGPEGDEIARKRVEDFANKIRPASFLDYIQIHSVDLEDDGTVVG